MKKLYYLAVMALMALCASVAISCGSDDDVVTPGGGGGSTFSYADTIIINAKIPADVKSMYQLHYYVVDATGNESEVDEIPVTNQVHSGIVLYTFGYKIVSGIQQGVSESDDDFKNRVSSIIAGWVAESGKTYADIDIKIDVTSHFQSWFNGKRDYGAENSFHEVSLAEYMKNKGMTDAEAAFKAEAKDIFFSDFNNKPIQKFAYNVTSSTTGVGFSVYTWKK